MNGTPPQKIPSILIVDDEKSVRLMLRRIMEREGYTVIEAADGEQCLEIFQPHDVTAQPPSEIPDIILLDAMMPSINGFTCCSQLQEILGEQCPPILMVTALNDRISVHQAFGAGATDYITKPIQWTVLLQRVRRLLQTHWALQEQKRLLTELRATMEHERLLKTQLETANQKLEHLASLDGLTQLANRRSFDECLQQEWQRLTREEAMLALILCDIDFFKVYNDSYGHLAGDECLKQVADVLRFIIRRPADLAARYGGEEFVVLLPNTEIKGAVWVAERIWDELRDRAIAHSGSQVSSYVTLSMGIAGVIPSTQFAPTDLIAWADKALYQAKLQGRNQHRVFTLNA